MLIKRRMKKKDIIKKNASKNHLKVIMFARCFDDKKEGYFGFDSENTKILHNVASPKVNLN